MYLNPTALTDYGWQRVDGKLEVLWDTPENIASACQRVQYALHGCKCKTGCTTRRCKCLKESRKCGPGCQCIGCLNTAFTRPSVDNELHELEVQDLRDEHDDAGAFTDESDDALDSTDELEDEVETLMEFVFGDESDEEQA